MAPCHIGSPGICFLVVWQVRQPRLEIKRDAKGMVIVPGAVMVEVTTARELLATFEKVRTTLSLA